MKDGFPSPILTRMPSAVSVTAFAYVAALCCNVRRRPSVSFLRPPFLGPLPLVQPFYFCIFTTLLNCYAIWTVGIVINVVVLCVFCDFKSCCGIGDLLENKNGWSCHAARRGGKPCNLQHRLLAF